MRKSVVLSCIAFPYSCIIFLYFCFCVWSKGFAAHMKSTGNNERTAFTWSRKWKIRLVRFIMYENSRNDTFIIYDPTVLRTSLKYNYYKRSNVYLRYIYFTKQRCGIFEDADDKYKTYAIKSYGKNKTRIVNRARRVGAMGGLRNDNMK